MPVIIPDCTSCKNINNKNQDGKYCCAAFPNGIPDDYFWAKINVRQLKECSNNVKFEKAND